jgi:hypothetical protein
MALVVAGGSAPSVRPGLVVLAATTSASRQACPLPSSPGCSATLTAAVILEGSLVMSRLFKDERYLKLAAEHLRQFIENSVRA